MGNTLDDYRAAIGLFNRSHFRSSNNVNGLTFLCICINLLILIISGYLLLPNNASIVYYYYFLVATVIMMLSTWYTKSSICCCAKPFFLKQVKQYDISLKILVGGVVLLENIVLCLTSYYTRLLMLAGDVECNPGPCGISICHINIRGLSSAKLLAIKHQIQNKFDIITLSETFLSENSTQDLALQGYHQLIRRDRDTFGGGVAAYVSCNLAYKRLSDFELANNESLWLKINTKNNKFLLAICYRPPTSGADYWEDMQTMYDNVTSQGVMPVIITGDLNSDFNSRNGELLHHFASSNFLTIHVHQPTRITETTATVLDQFISNNHNLLTDIQVHPPLATNDHCTISAIISFKSFKEENYFRNIWNYNNADFGNFNEAIRNYDWDTCFESNDINECLANWTTSFLNLARTYIPNKMILVRSKDSPWFSKELRNLKKEKDRIHRQAKLSNCPVIWSNFRKARNKYIGRLREAEEQYKHKLANKLENPVQVSSKQWWHITKQFLGKYSHDSIPPISDPLTDNTLFTSTEKADAFNTAFSSFSNIDTSNATVPNHVHKKTDSSLTEIIVEVQEVEDILLSLDTSKASGPDSISAKMLKVSAKAIAPSLTRLISMSLRSKIVPQGWKDANVTPIFKKGNKSICSNYRPISLLNITAKICEKLIFRHLFNYIRDNNLITSHQSGFMPGDSTVNQLVYLYNTFLKALNEKKDIRVVFCDQSKAFDKVWHEGLLYKLKTFGIEGSLHEWFVSYLAHRRQRVTIKNGLSSWCDVRAGVPQGSILGPLLFLVHINDIIDNIQSEIKLFADDTSLYVIMDRNEQTCIQQLNTDLETINNWAKTWLVTFNPEKSESLFITLKPNQVASPVYLDNQELKLVTSHKHLGVTFNNTLTWNNHVDSICSAANKKVTLLTKLKYILDRKTLQTMYCSFVRPSMEYANIIWNNCSDNDCDRLESIQRRALRTITGGIVRTSSDLLYEEIGLEPLVKRRERSILLFFHKIMYSNCPGYLHNLKPHITQARHNRNLRSGNKLDLPKSRIVRHESSLIPKAISMWNNLPKEIQDIADYKYFKSQLQEAVPKCNDLFFIGERKFNIILARLRMKCSDLHGHLFQLKIINNSSCKCGYFFEDSVHYFFVCPLYAQARYALHNFVSPLCSFNLKTLLYGCSDLSTDTNASIIHEVIKYIIATKRFN
jgi:hypothetical protein